MKRIFLLSIFLFICISSMFGDVYVNGYRRKDGTYVQGHYRSNPDGKFSNNWTTKGNVNPHTGKIGTKTINSNNSFSTVFNFDNNSKSKNLTFSNRSISYETQNKTAPKYRSLEETKKETDQLMLVYCLEIYEELLKKDNLSKEDEERKTRVATSIIEYGGADQLVELNNLYGNQKSTETEDSSHDLFFNVVIPIMIIILIVLSIEGIKNTKEKDK